VVGLVVWQQILLGPYWRVSGALFGMMMVIEPKHVGAVLV